MLFDVQGQETKALFLSSKSFPGINCSLRFLNRVKLNLNLNNIKEISDKAFQNVPKLITLNLNQNKITGISPSGFDGIGNLQNLTMSTNKLSSIEMSSLEPLKKLVKFHLDSNRLKELPAVSTYVFNFYENLSCLFPREPVEN